MTAHDPSMRNGWAVIDRPTVTHAQSLLWPIIRFELEIPLQAGLDLHLLRESGSCWGPAHQPAGGTGKCRAEQPGRHRAVFGRADGIRRDHRVGDLRDGRMPRLRRRYLPAVFHHAASASRLPDRAAGRRVDRFPVRVLGNHPGTAGRHPHAVGRQGSHGADSPVGLRAALPALHCNDSLLDRACSLR